MKFVSTFSKLNVDFYSFVFHEKNRRCSASCLREGFLLIIAKLAMSTFRIVNVSVPKNTDITNSWPIGRRVDSAGPTVNEVLMEALNEMLKQLPATKVNRKIAQFVIDNPAEVAFMTTTDIARKLDISDASVLRFARSLGHATFADFRKSLQHGVTEQLNHQREAFFSQAELYIAAQEANGNSSLMEKMLHSSMQIIQTMLEKNPEHKFDEIVEMLIKSRKKYICGFRMEAVPARKLGMLMRFILEDVIINTDLDSQAIETMLDINEKDCFVLFSFSRYSKPAQDLLAFARAKGCKIIVISDMETAPVALQSDISLVCNTDIGSYFSSNLGSILAAEIILAKLGAACRPQFDKRWSEMDDFIRKYGFF